MQQEGRSDDGSDCAADGSSSASEKEPGNKQAAEDTEELQIATDQTVGKTMGCNALRNKFGSTHAKVEIEERDEELIDRILTSV